MSNKLISISLALVLMWPLVANDLKDSSAPNRPGKDLTALPGIGQDLTIIGSSVDYDAVLTENDAMPAYMAYGLSRGTADTLAYVPADGGWNGSLFKALATLCW